MFVIDIFSIAPFLTVGGNENQPDGGSSPCATEGGSV